MMDDRVSELELERQRVALYEQWEANHIEHCSREWPHPEGVDCHWPVPDELANHGWVIG